MRRLATNLRFPKALRVNLLLVFTLAMVTVAIQGCTTPIEKAVTTRAVFNGSVNAVNEARRQNFLSPQDFDTINDTQHTLMPLLDELDMAAIKATAANSLDLKAQFDFNKVYNAVRDQLKILAARYYSVKTNSKPVANLSASPAAGS